MDERILNLNLFSKMIYDEATRSDSHFNHLSVFLLPNEMGGSQTRPHSAVDMAGAAKSSKPHLLQLTLYPSMYFICASTNFLDHRKKI